MRIILIVTFLAVSFGASTATAREPWWDLDYVSRPLLTRGHQKGHIVGNCIRRVVLGPDYAYTGEGAKCCVCCEVEQPVANEAFEVSQRSAPEDPWRGFALRGFTWNKRYKPQPALDQYSHNS